MDFFCFSLQKAIRDLYKRGSLKRKVLSLFDEAKFKMFAYKLTDKHFLKIKF